MTNYDDSNDDRDGGDYDAHDNGRASNITITMTAIAMRRKTLGRKRTMIKVSLQNMAMSLWANGNGTIGPRRERKHVHGATWTGVMESARLAGESMRKRSDGGAKEPPGA